MMIKKYSDFLNESKEHEDLEERVQILDNLYDQRNCEKEYLFGISENVYRVKSYLSGFNELYNKLTPIELYKKMYDGEKVKFDLTDGSCCFDFKPDYSIITKKLFTREVCF